MENAASTTPITGNVFLRVRTMESTETTPLVVITSVLTQTIRPTLVVTESTVITPTSENTQTVLEQVVITRVDHQLRPTYLETSPPASVLRQTTLQDTLLSTSNSPSTTIKTSFFPAEAQTTSPSAEHETGLLGHLNVSTNTSDPAPTHTLSANTSTLWSSSTIAFSVTTLPSITSSAANSAQLISITISPSPSLASSQTSSPSTSPIQTATTGPGPAQDSTSHKGKSLDVGAIVGGTLGGAGLIALSLLACFLLSRRKRQRAFYGRQDSRCSVHPSRTSSIHPPHNRQISEPTFPCVEAFDIPSAPVFPIRSYSTPNGARPGLFSTPSNNNASSDRVSLKDDYDQRTKDPFADPENNLTSPSLEVFPPSRTESMYSESSWGSGSKLLERHDRSLRSSRYGSSYYPDESTLTPPRSSVGPDSFTYTKNRASTRSDPFDLEPPPDVLPRWPL